MSYQVANRQVSALRDRTSLFSQQTISGKPQLFYYSGFCRFARNQVSGE
ncbi:hypothetical protein [Brunnivagina elsteri]|nr:hypothetical protein [Calothrix elsteri]